MAYADTHFSTSSLFHSLARPFLAVSNLMDLVAQASAKADAANRIVEMSDEKLAAKGLTRSEAIRNLFDE